MAPAPARRRHLLGQHGLLRLLAGTAVVVAATTATSGVLTMERRPAADSIRATPVGPAVAASGPGALSTSDCSPNTATLRRWAGLVLVVGLPGVTRPNDPLIDVLADIGVGGVMLRADNLTSLRQARTLVSGIRERLGAHVLVAVDEEGGRVTALRALGGTEASARRLGKAGAAAARAAGEDLGELAASIGIDWILGPVVDLDAGPASGVIGDRSFGGDGEEVAVTAGAYIDGLRASGLHVTLKHFPGHGSTDSEPHAGTTADHRNLIDLAFHDLFPFHALIDDGAESVMVGHVIYPEIWGDVPASLTPAVYDLLRETGFDGVAITDAVGMGAVYNQWGFDTSPAMALDAGADAVLATQGDRAVELRDGIVQAVQLGTLDGARLAEATDRMLDLRGEEASGIPCS